MTPAERKRVQRQRDRLAGWAEVAVKVDAERVEEVRAFVASLPPPPPPTDPAQLSMLDQLDAQLSGGDETRDASPSAQQGMLL